MTCTVPTVKGLITVHYKKTDEKYLVNITLPEDIRADVYVPTGAEVNINSVVFDNNNDSVRLTEKDILLY